MRSFQIAYGQLHPVLFWPRTTNSDLKFETRRRICCCKVQNANVQLYQPSLLVIGGGAAGVYGAIKAKSVMPQLKVTVIEKGKILSKVLISGGGRCNLTNAHFVNTELLADQYPRGTKELRGLYFKSHGPSDTMAWFSEHGVQLKTEDDGRVFPVSDKSSTVIDCLLAEAQKHGVSLETGVTALNIILGSNGFFEVQVCKRDRILEILQANYILMATGSCPQGYKLASQLGHTIIAPRPSLFTFKIKDPHLNNLSGVSFSKVIAWLKIPELHRNVPQLKQVGSMLITHWGLSGPAILRLSAWAARILYETKYKGTLLVDFVPDIAVDDITQLLQRHKKKHLRQRLKNSVPSELNFPKRFWKYLLDEQGLNSNIVWSSVPNNQLQQLASCMKHCSFDLHGKGEFKDEFVTAGGISLSEINLKTMESRKQPNLFLAGEVINVDGLTGGFNLQNAWTSAYLAGTSIGLLASQSINSSINEEPCLLDQF